MDSRLQKRLLEWLGRQAKIAANAMKAIVALLALCCASCATVPKFIDGQRVIGTKWVNNHVVYVVEGNREIMLTKAQEGELAGRGVVFRPTDGK